MNKDPLFGSPYSQDRRRLGVCEQHPPSPPPRLLKEKTYDYVYGSSLNYCSQNGGNLYRAPYYNGNPNIGPRIIGNLDQSPYG